MKKVGNFKNVKDINIELNGRNVYGLELRDYQDGEIHVVPLDEVYVMKENGIFDGGYEYYSVDKDIDLEGYIFIPYGGLPEDTEIIESLEEMDEEIDVELDVINIDEFFKNVGKENQTILNLDNGYGLDGIDIIIDPDLTGINIYENENCLLIAPNVLFRLTSATENNFLYDTFTINDEGVLVFSDIDGNYENEYDHTYDSSESKEMLKVAIEDILS